MKLLSSCEILFIRTRTELGVIVSKVHLKNSRLLARGDFYAHTRNLPLDSVSERNELALVVYEGNYPKLC